ncbi:calcium/sodium antiporter [Candidatus Poribacteria bacterium]|nr:calcium/sodium antiporter [Candidatus Poribacteria bacterium]
MSFVNVGLFVLGLALLILGAETLVRGASRLAGSMGIPPLIIGLTVVAYGTGAPELTISLMALANGQGDLSVGNVLGSNIANILLILGVSALAAPLIVSRRLVWIDAPLMVGAAIAAYAFSLDGRVERWEGLVLFVAAVGYTVFLVRSSRPARGSDDQGEDYAAAMRRKGVGRENLFFYAALVFAGLAMLILGSRWLVGAATTFARALHVSELVIGLTIVAGGTSLPELATSLLAAMRGERDIAVGNIVGSSIFNLLVVLGLAAASAPDGVAVSSAALGFDYPVLLAASFACLPIFFTGHRIARWEGGLFLAYYAAYLAYLGLHARAHTALPLYGWVMLTFVAPLTFVTLGVLSVRQLRSRA